MALIPCPACGRQVSEAAPTCPGCGHPVAPQGQSSTFKDALMRPDTVRSGITVLGVFFAAPWIARVFAVALFVILAIVVILTKR